MTLNTVVYIEAPYPRRDAFEAALVAICKAADREVLVEDVKTEDHLADWSPGLLWTWSTPGQGLPGIVEIRYRQDGPLATEDTYDEDGWIDQRRCCLEVSWDTAYGYRDRHGGCRELHASALEYLRRLIPSRIPMSWQNEFTSEIFPLTFDPIVYRDRTAA